MMLLQATLEEVVEADILLHVLDASSPNVLQQRETVNQVASLQIAATPALMFFIQAGQCSKSRYPHLFLSSALPCGQKWVAQISQDTRKHCIFLIRFWVRAAGMRMAPLRLQGVPVVRMQHLS